MTLERYGSLQRLKHKHDKNKKNTPLLSKVMVPMIILALLQICVFGILLAVSGGLTYIKNYSYNLLYEKTENRKNFIENTFIQKTALVYETANEINEMTQKILEEEAATAQSISRDKELNKQILSSCSESLISLIRRDMVNDAFIILESGTLYDAEGRQLRTGLYFRDTDVEENSVSDNQDIFMQMGSSEIAGNLGVTLDFTWSLYLDVTDNEDGRFDFFYKPMNEVSKNKDIPLYNLGYWSSLMGITREQQGSVKYTLPLVAEDGTVYGVIGIGMLEKTIQQSVPSQDFLSDTTCYILATDLEGTGKYRPIIHRGSAFTRLVDEDCVLSADKPVEYGVYDFTRGDKPESIGCIHRMNLYKSGSPYRRQNWALISVADKAMLLNTYYRLMRTLIISALVTLAISVLFAVIISSRISSPVEKMAGTLNERQKSHQIVEFNPTGIAEIDALASSIVDLQVDVTEYASRVSRIITMSGNRLGVFMYDCMNQTVFVGESLIKLLNFTELPEKDVTISGQEFKDRLAGIDKENVIMNLPIFLDTGNHEQPLNDSRELFSISQDGTVIWFKFSLTRDKNRVMGLVQDITNTVAEKKKIAKSKDDEYTAKLLEANKELRAACAAAEHANHTKTDFLSRMSHDIRTPMNAIMGMTAIAENNLDDREKLVDCINKISASSNYLLALINEILDMSKIEAGKFVLAEEKINLPELVDNVIEMLKPSVKERNHKLEVHMNRMEHENVISDSLRIRQIFMNIMSNAVKYTPDGGLLKIYISEKNTGQSKVGCYEFIFMDNGKGMQPEFIEKLFVSFEREEDERVSKEQGTGLGMTITYNIVKLMNGDIQVQSEVNKGTTFTVTLNLPLDEEESGQVAELVGKSILVAEHDKNSGISTCKILEDIGMQVQLVQTGQEAMKRTAQAYKHNRNYDAVLVDWELEDMDGIDAVRNISGYSTGKMPIILCSENNWSKVEAEAREAGVDAFLSKPVFRSRLITVLKSLFKNGGGDVLQAFMHVDLSAYRVLLVEDNELNREIAKEILGMVKLQIEEAVDGRKAVDMFTRSEVGYYNMILMDIQMPVMNGYEASKAIRKLPREDAGTIPIVAMTANAYAEDVRDAEKAGMNEHIAKPLDIAKLYKTIHKWLHIEL